MNGPINCWKSSVEVFELAQHDIREAIVDLGDIDVGRRDAGRGERARCSFGDAEAGELGALRDRARTVGMSFGDAADVYRSRAQIARAPHC